MIPLRFVIVDFDSHDDETSAPLFWSNEDGWVGWGTESILEATAAETETLRLPMGGRVQWITSKSAGELVQQFA